MISFARTDTSIVGRWWWTVDRWTLLALALLIGAGILLTLAASPAVADRLGYESFHFVRRQAMYLVPSIVAIFAISLLSPRGVRRFAVIGFVASFVLMLLTLVAGPDVNGATRWLMVGGLSLQPSEFVKPFFAVTAAWLFTQQKQQPRVPGNLISCLLFAAVVAVLVMQPDYGMAVVITAVWAAQFFVAGMPLAWVGSLVGLGMGGGVLAYLFVPHVASRIDRFRDPSAGDHYQIETALEAFSNGGLLGRGPGEGVVKRILPDAHTDFIFAVAGEEFGLIACLVIVALFAFITLRGFGLLLRQNSLFVLLAAGGLLVQFASQAIINMGVNLRLLPTKGMTLPFISYGGSSLFALAIGMGMLLALTRKRPLAGDEP